MVRLILVVAESAEEPLSCVSNCYNLGLDSIRRRSGITKRRKHIVYFMVLVLKIKISDFCGHILQLHLLRLKSREHGLEVLNVGGIKCKMSMRWEILLTLTFGKQNPF